MALGQLFMIYTDAHIHLDSLYDQKEILRSLSQMYIASTVAYTHDDSFFSELKNMSKTIFVGSGVHPYYVNEEELEKFDIFLQNNHELLDFIGEIGFDFTSKNQQKEAAFQEYAFCQQVLLAQKYSLPVVIHCCKGMHKILQYKDFFKKLPAVIFHGYNGSVQDAHRLLAVNSHTYFSFGTALLKNHTKTIQTFTDLPIENLLLESDGPFQLPSLFSSFDTNVIKAVYLQGADLRSMTLENFTGQILQNFVGCFSINHN